MSHELFYLHFSQNNYIAFIQQQESISLDLFSEFLNQVDDRGPKCFSLTRDIFHYFCKWLSPRLSSTTSCPLAPNSQPIPIPFLTHTKNCTIFHWCSVVQTTKFKDRRHLKWKEMDSWLCKEPVTKLKQKKGNWPKSLNCRSVAFPILFHGPPNNQFHVKVHTNDIASNNENQNRRLKHIRETM